MQNTHRDHLNLVTSKLLNESNRSNYSSKWEVRDQKRDHIFTKPIGSAFNTTADSKETSLIEQSSTKSRPKHDIKRDLKSIDSITISNEGKPHESEYIRYESEDDKASIGTARERGG